jgi:hypothetical protein
MVSPQEMHNMVGALSGMRGRRSMAGAEDVSFGMCDSTDTGGSAIELSVTDAWQRAAVGDEAYVRLIMTVARCGFEQSGSKFAQHLRSVSKKERINWPT